jgi:hypothetical protein
MYGNDNSNDYRAGKCGVCDDSIPKHFVFEWHGECKLDPNRRSGPLYVFMDKQCRDSKHNKPSSGFLHGHGTRCEWLYGSIHWNCINDLKSIAGTDFEYYGYYNINVYESNDCVTSNRRSHVCLDRRFNPE